MKTDSVFTQCFFFLRQHNAGVENISDMKAAGFSGVFCNIGDPVSPPEAWSTIRQRCKDENMFCGPWLRTGQTEFDETTLYRVIDVADEWGSPGIINSESEIDFSGNAYTTFIRQEIGDRDFAVSTLDIPMDEVDWTPLHDIPILPQLFVDGGRTSVYDVKDMWHAYGVECVFPTFGSYGGRTPQDYDLKAPYSIYTADDCGQNYQAWRPTSTGYIGCKPKTEVKVAGVKTEIDKAWDHFEKATVPDKWQEQNQGEYNKIKSYYFSTGNTPVPTGIISEFGQGLLALVEAGKWADGTHI